MIDKLAALRRTALFGSLEDSQLQALADRAVAQHVARDEIVFLAGEPAKGLYVIVEGSLRAFRENLEGREQIIHVDRAGATIAEVPVFDDGAYPATVAAEEETTLLFIDRRDVQRLCLEHPPIALAALKLLAGRLRRCSELVAVLSLHDVGQRVARLLLAEARREGRRQGTALDFELSLTNEQVAIRIGSVREVVSRALSRLQHEGLIKVEGKHVTIPDEEALDAFSRE